jgi:DNA-binding LacI/PurR family transcriptional regulator
MYRRPSGRLWRGASRPRPLARCQRNSRQDASGTYFQMVSNKPLICRADYAKLRVVPRRKKNSNLEFQDDSKQKIGLRQLAKHLGLSTTSLSVVLNDAPGADSIPQETKDRIFEAAEKFNYRPNYFARTLRAQRSFTFGVLVPELSDGYSAMVLSGVEDELLKANYFYIIASHHHRKDLLKEYPRMFAERRVEGIIAVDTEFETPLDIPAVTVSGHKEVKGVTNIVLNHTRAAELAFEHLIKLGHRRIAFLQGQVFSSDTQIRWEAIEAAAKKHNIEINPEFVDRLEGDNPSPETGYLATRRILMRRDRSFTALFAFNDVSAIGAIRALQEAGLRVPQDVSVLGFDDIYGAAFHNPALTTIRQPLFEMGRLAAQTLLKSIDGKEEQPPLISAEPTLIIRDSCAVAKYLY